MRQSGCVSQDAEPPDSTLISGKSTSVLEPTLRVRFTNATQRLANIPENKGPSLGKLQVKVLHQCSPYASKFEDRSQEETGGQERCARGDAWRLAKNILKLKETVSILSHTRTHLSRLRPLTRTRTRPSHYNTIQPNTTTGLALCRRVILDSEAHRWVQAGHPRYTGARKGRLWVAYNLFHATTASQQYASNKRALRKQVKTTHVRHNNQVLTDTWNLAW